MRVNVLHQVSHVINVLKHWEKFQCFSACRFSVIAENDNSEETIMIQDVKLGTERIGTLFPGSDATLE